jgi:hypothetical protein
VCLICLEKVGVHRARAPTCTLAPAYRSAQLRPQHTLPCALVFL